MDIGTGIAIAGAWFFPAACALSKTTSAFGLWVAIAAASIVTGVVL